jgi:hypothetical protein
MQRRPTGPLQWFGSELEEDDFRSRLRAERRIIYEFDPHHAYGLA